MVSRQNTEKHQTWKKEYYILENTGAIELEFTNDKCELVAIAVNPKRKGYGSKLLHFAEELSKRKGCKTIWCYTLDINNATEFYIKKGWKEEKHIPEFFDGHGCFKFSKVLK